MKRSFLVLAAGTLFTLLHAAAGFSAKVKHFDAYVQGSVEESTLISEVRHKLVMLPRYGVFDDIGFRVNGSTVTLEGQVREPVLKDDAARTVRKIDGVTSVVNNLEVLPLSPNDDRVRHDVYRAVYGAEDIGMRYGFSAVPSIHIIVKNGNVRLEGVVANEFDRNLINVNAQGVAGAFTVVNELEVENQKER